MIKHIFSHIAVEMWEKMWRKWITVCGKPRNPQKKIRSKLRTTEKRPVERKKLCKQSGVIQQFEKRGNRGKVSIFLRESKRRC